MNLLTKCYLRHEGKIEYTGNRAKDIMFRTFKTLQSRFSVKFAVVCAFALLFSYGANAQFAASPCDPNYLDSLEARAWLEAQREITQNQNLIFKPDSVLEYTCFEGHLAELAQHAEDMFSETDRWNPPAVLTTPVAQNIHMDNALILLVADAFEAYDSANFDHNLLGGRSGAARNYTAPAAGSNIGGNYTCNVMQTVWLQAKCMNFIHRAHDGFFTFDEYQSSTDKRFLPTGCPGPGATTWQSRMDSATDTDPDPATTTTSWEPDNVVTYLDNFYPDTATAATCSSASAPASCCGDAASNFIKTGLVVSRFDSSTPFYYNEYVCLVPGCHWEPDSGSTTPTTPQNNGECIVQ